MQRSSTFFAPRTSFLEDNFSTRGGRGRGGRDDSSVLPLLYALFLLLLHHLHLRSSGIKSQSSGDPCSTVFFVGCWKSPPSPLNFSLCHSVLNSVLRKNSFGSLRTPGREPVLPRGLQHLFMNHPHLPQGDSPLKSASPFTGEQTESHNFCLQDWEGPGRVGELTIPSEGQKPGCRCS